MTEERARRWALIARVVHTVDIVVMVGLVVAVLASGQPSWLLTLVAPTALLSVAVQLMAFRAEAGMDDLRFWSPLEQEQNQGP